MDDLLEKIIFSDKPENLKKALVLKLCEAAVEKSDCEQEIRTILQISKRWILYGTTSLQLTLGLKMFKTWGSLNDGIFKSFFNLPMITNLLTEDEGNVPNTPLLIKEGLQVIKSMNSGYQSHAKLIDSHIAQFAFCSNQEWQVLYNVSSLLLEFKTCIPLKVIDATNLCMIYVRLLCNRVYPTQKDEIETFTKTTDEVAKLLGYLWSHHHLSVIADSLAEVFKIISSPRVEEDKPESTICLASLVRHVPIDMVSKFVEDAVGNSSHSDEMLEAAIGQIVEWLKWPTAQNLDHWLVCFLAGLAANHRITSLVNITEICSEQFAEGIANPVLREILFNVLSQSLLGFQRSPEPFHKFLEKIPTVLYYLKTVHSAQTQQLYRQMCDLIYCLMFKHSGFPEIYQPFLYAMKPDFPWPPSEQMKQKLDSSKWVTRTTYAGEVDKYELPMVVTNIKREKAEMGKTGLENLGNSCYMNSVIQALYMCDIFCDDVLRKKPSKMEGLLDRLQVLFAQIKYTKRPAIAPSTFFHASRPMSFQAGHQQDCSEYLKYLLDQLHEDETHPSNVDDNSKESAMDSDELLSTGGDSAMVPTTKVKKENASLSRTQPPKCCIERIFRGKIHTTLRCLACRQKSSRIESFTDIPLAFPNSSRTSEYPRNNNLAGGSVAPGSSKMAESMRSSTQKGLADQPGKLCINDLISFYLKPEKLVGDNKYYCGACKELQDGEKCIEIAESPTYLILTLMRFSYNIKQHVRTKILQDVRYPRTISLPVCDGQSDGTDLLIRAETGDSGDNEMENSHGDSVLADQDELMDVTECQAEAKSKDPRRQLYSLSAVIVHSGSSSESGHYYCYARHSKFDPYTPLPSNCDKDTLKQDFLPDLWYNFNDSRVSATQFDSFSNVTQRFSNDTPYVLIYTKLQPASVDNAPGPLQKLIDLVNKDNELFHEEQEKEAKLQQRRRSRSSISHRKNHYMPKRDSDDDDEDSNGGHHGLGFSNDHCVSGPRFVY